MMAKIELQGSTWIEPYERISVKQQKDAVNRARLGSLTPASTGQTGRLFELPF